MHILAYDCLVEPDRMEIQDPVLYALLLTGNKKYSRNQQVLFKIPLPQAIWNEFGYATVNSNVCFILQSSK